jgi:hypothetical protein
MLVERAGSNLGAFEVLMADSDMLDDVVSVPRSIQAARWLTPWAAQLRYEMLEPLDRDAAVSVVTDAVAWARTLIEEAEAEQEPPEEAEAGTGAPHASGTEPGRSSRPLRPLRGVRGESVIRLV